MVILYFLGVYLGVGELAECGALDYVGIWLEGYVDNVYIYGLVVGVLSSILDNVPLVMAGMNLFHVDMALDSTSEFAQNGIYWQLLSYCCACGGCLLFVGSMAGQAMLEVERIRFKWYIRHYLWRALVAWMVGLAVFWLIH